MPPAINHTALAELAYWITERENIRRKKEQGLPKPWSSDPLFQQYKFCNVQREHDTVTVWIRQHIREPYAEDPNLWFMLCLARQINWPATLEELKGRGAWPSERRGFVPDRMVEILRERRARGDKVYTGAYMIQGDVHALPGEKDKPGYTVYDALLPLWEDQLKPEPGESLESYHGRLMGSRAMGWGSFMAGQAVCDMKYTKHLKLAPDWWDWAALGPGSTKGLNILFDREVKKGLSQRQGLDEMLQARELVRSRIQGASSAYFAGWHLQDFQNCLCEFSKYYLAKRGLGRMRARYPGAA